MLPAYSNSWHIRPGGKQSASQRHGRTASQHPRTSRASDSAYSTQSSIASSFCGTLSRNQPTQLGTAFRADSGIAGVFNVRISVCKVFPVNPLRFRPSGPKTYRIQVNNNSTDNSGIRPCVPPVPRCLRVISVESSTISRPATSAHRVRVPMIETDGPQMTAKHGLKRISNASQMQRPAGPKLTDGFESTHQPGQPPAHAAPSIQTTQTSSERWLAPLSPRRWPRVAPLSPPVPVIR